MAEYKVNGQMNLGWNQSFAATKAVPMIAKRVWDTLENATLFAKEDATAVVGLILTVNNDSTNNGVYRIAAIGANAVLEKIGSTEGYATEQWVKDQNYLTEHQDLSDYAKKSDLTIVYKYKGSVASFENLPTEGLSNGDVYNVETTGINYAWVAETLTWDKLGGHEDLSEYENVIEKVYVKSDDTTTTLLPVNDKAVTIDLSGINERLDAFDLIISGGEGEGITELIEGKQDKLADGSAEKPHLIWSNEGWTPGKIEMPSEERLVPETVGVENPAILVWNGTEVIWSASEVQKELPEYTLADEGKILVVAKTTNENNEEVAEVVWAEAPNNTTITNTVEESVTISSVISNGVDSVDVYSKDGVNKLLSWEQL